MTSVSEKLFHRRFAARADFRHCKTNNPRPLPSSGAHILAMNAFPDLMKNPANRIARSNQATLGAEGYVFDGNDGSQMAFWTCAEDAVSAEHTHEYDEYMVVVQGCYTLVINGHRIPINAGEE